MRVVPPVEVPQTATFQPHRQVALPVQDVPAGHGGEVGASVLAARGASPDRPVRLHRIEAVEGAHLVDLGHRHRQVAVSQRLLGFQQAHVGTLDQGDVVFPGRVLLLAVVDRLAVGAVAAGATLRIIRAVRPRRSGVAGTVDPSHRHVGGHLVAAVSLVPYLAGLPSRIGRVVGDPDEVGGHFGGVGGHRAPVVQTDVDLSQGTLRCMDDVLPTGGAAVPDGFVQRRNCPLECLFPIYVVAGVHFSAGPRVVVRVRGAENDSAEVLAEPAIRQPCKEPRPSRVLVAVERVSVDPGHPDQAAFGHPPGSLDTGPEAVCVVGVEETPAVPTGGEVASRPHDLVGEDRRREGQVVVAHGEVRGHPRH